MKLCSESLWENLCATDATCTFFQTPAWHGIAARHYRAEQTPLLFRFGETSACLPLLKKRRWGRDHYFSPFGTYTALVCPRRLAAGELAAVAQELKELNLHLISSPFTSNTVKAGKILISRAQIIDLTSLDPGNPMRDWERDARRRVRGAVRDKVQVRTARSEADWERYYELYQLSLDRWGNKKTGEYPKTLFDDIRRSLDGNSFMRLWSAGKDGEIGANILVFYHNRHVALWHSGTDQRFFSLGAVQLLFFTLIKDALQRGFSVFDLGGSNGLAGVEAFKRQFGARTIEFESSLNRPGFPGFLAGLRDALKSGLEKIHITR